MDGVFSVSPEILVFNGPWSSNPTPLQRFGICRRRGLGRVRHLHVADLWVQDKIRCGAFSLTKIAGADNPADVLTTYVERPTMVKHLQTLRLWPEERRAASALVIEHTVFQLLRGLRQMTSI